jgi:intracellular septation protein
MATVARLPGFTSVTARPSPCQVSLAIIAVFGATILLHNETFIKWKPTVLYWLFAR